MFNIKPNPLMIPNFLGSKVPPPLNTFPPAFSSINPTPQMTPPSSLLALLSAPDYAFTAPSLKLQDLPPLPNYRFAITKGDSPSTSGGGTSGGGQNRSRG